MKLTEHCCCFAELRHSFSQRWLSLAAQRSVEHSQSREMKVRDHILSEAEAVLGSALEVTLEVAGSRLPERKRGMILPFQPLSISFDDLKYSVDMPAVSSHNSLIMLQFYMVLSIDQ